MGLTTAATRLREFFGREYFDSGKDGAGMFKEYTLSSKYREFEFLTSRLNSMFRPRKVLDVGCAKGFLVLAFANLGVEAYGIDVSPYALDQAPQSIRGGLMEIDLNKQKLPFDKGTFGLITALGILEYISDLENALAEIRRVIRDDGVLFVRTYYPRSGAKNWVQPLFENVKEFRLRDEGAWIDELESHGFEFMQELTNKNYARYIQMWLEDALTNGHGLRYWLGRRVYSVPKFGRWLLSRHARSVIGLLFFKPK